jgi:hypothetical protein
LTNIENFSSILIISRGKGNSIGLKTAGNTKLTTIYNILKKPAKSDIAVFEKKKLGKSKISGSHFIIDRSNYKLLFCHG